MSTVGCNEAPTVGSFVLFQFYFTMCNGLQATCVVKDDGHNCDQQDEMSSRREAGNLWADDLMTVKLAGRLSVLCPHWQPNVTLIIASLHGVRLRSSFLRYAFYWWPF